MPSSPRSKRSLQVRAEIPRVCPCVSRTKSEIDAVPVLILNKMHNFLKENGSRVSTWMFERSRVSHEG